jgi:anti-sigma B factor antagonist
VTSLSLETREEDGGVQIAVSGELDLSSALTFDEEVRRAEERLPQALVLDLRRLRFMDSTGLRLIMEIDALAREDGFNFSVVRGSPAVHRVMEISGVEDHLVLIDAPDDLNI